MTNKDFTENKSSLLIYTRGDNHEKENFII